MQNNKIVFSNSLNPYYNLALEEYLLNKTSENDITLYLWQNSNTVVIGSNQNPWKECSISKIRDEDVHLVRRMSGGGAVYHDSGNLNYTFIAGNNLYDEKKHLSCILDAVNSFGAKAEFSGRNDLLCRERKFSGNAYYFDDEASFLHGTLLIDVDMNRLSRYLTPSKRKIESKGIDSVKSRVINLKDINAGITIDSIKKELCNSFENIYGRVSGVNEYSDDGSDEELNRLKAKYASWAQSFGESPEFDVVHQDKFDWGEISFGMILRDAKIISVEIYSDALDTRLIEALRDALNGVKYSDADIGNAIANMRYHSEDKKTVCDILSLFKEI